MTDTTIPFMHRDASVPRALRAHVRLACVVSYSRIAPVPLACKAWCPGHSRNSHVPRFIASCDSTQLVRTMEFNINLLPLVAACATCLFLFLSASYLSPGHSWHIMHRMGERGGRS